MENLLNDILQYDIPIFKGKKIIDCISLSNSFGSFCAKIYLEDNNLFVVKGSKNQDNVYDSIYFEGKSIALMKKKYPDIFPKIFYINKNIFVIEYIEHNKIKNQDSEKDFAYKLAKIHQQKNDLFGFEFDPPIGGLKQPSAFENSWVDFFGNKRLRMIFDLINSTNPMPKKINKGIENIIKNLKNIIPNNPKPSLIHGDLWDGNILFHNGKLVGLIDPGIYYAHNEMELAYLNWFKYINKIFFEYYSEFIKIDKSYYEYEEVYQLYYSLLNVHLWSREYIANVWDLVQKYN